MNTGYSRLPQLESPRPALFDPSRVVHPLELLRVVEAIRTAARSTTLPTMELVIIDDPKLLAELDYTAPMVLVAVCEQPSRADVEAYGTTLALGYVVQNLLHAAHAVGLSFQILSDGHRQLERALTIPALRTVAFAVGLGHAVLGTDPPARDLHELVHWNHYGEHPRD